MDQLINTSHIKNVKNILILKFSKNQMESE